MDTPIVDFINKYSKSETKRLHMPGHKGYYYLGFEHMDITEIDGADICCDSAHKTLPVLTGGAYLHISNPLLADEAKQALTLFGSTSPSYLIMSSLDFCNAYLSDDYEQKLKNTIYEINKVKYKLREQGWNIYDSNPLKLTIGATEFISGIDLADILRTHGIEPEFSDPDYLALMITPSNKQTDFSLIPDILGKASYYAGKNEYISSVKEIPHASGEQVISIRNAIFSSHEIINIKDAKGCICGAPTVACPPAIPIAVSGELIGDPEIRLFEYYGINEIEVVKELKNEY